MPLRSLFSHQNTLRSHDSFTTHSLTETGIKQKYSTKFQEAKIPAVFLSVSWQYETKFFIQGVFFKWPFPFSVSKRKTTGTQVLERLISKNAPANLSRKGGKTYCSPHIIFLSAPQTNCLFFLVTWRCLGRLRNKVVHLKEIASK